MRRRPDRPMTVREQNISTLMLAYEQYFPGVEPLEIKYICAWLNIAPLDKVLEIMEAAAHTDQNISPLRAPAGYIFSKLKRWQESEARCSA
jgi:hypothetical protein